MAYDLPPVVALITGNASELLAAIGESKAALSDLGDSTATASKKMDKAVEDSTDGQIASLGALGAAHEEVGEKASKAADDVEKAETRAEKDASGFSGRISSIFKGAGNTLGSWGIPFAESVSGMGEKIDEANTKGKGFSQSVSEIGGVITGVGVTALVGFGAESVHMADKFDSAVAQVSSSAGISVAAATKIGNAFKNIGGAESATDLEAAYGKVAGQLATVQGHALNAAQAVKIMTAASDLSDAKMGSLQTTTSALANVMQAYGLQAGAASKTSDLLYNTSTKTGVGIGQVATTLDRLHTQLGANAPSLSQVSGLLLDMTEHGETGRGALSALSAAFSGLITPAGALTTAQQQIANAQKQLGVSFENSKGQLDPLSQIIGELQPKIKGMGSAQAAALLSSIGFGSSASKMVSVIQAGPAAFDKATAAVTKTGTAHAAAAKQLDTLSGQGAVLKKQVENLGVSFGTFLIPKLEDLAKKVINAINWFKAHKAVAEALAGTIGGILTVAVGAFAVNTLGKLVSSVSSAIDNLGSFASKIGSVATTVLQKFGLIQSGSETMAEGVETNVDEMASTTEATTTGMATKIEQTATGEATSVEATTAGQATKVESDATGEATAVEATTGGMEAKVDADAVGEATAAEADTAGMAAGVEADVAGEAVAVEATATTMEADVAADAAASEAALGPVQLAIAAVAGGLATYGAGKAAGEALDASGQDNPESSASLSKDVAAGKTQSLGNAVSNAYAAAGAGGTPPLAASSGRAVNPAYPAGLETVIPIGGSTGSMTPVKKGAAGGLITKPTVGLFGESGPELLLPLTDPSRMAALLGSVASPLAAIGGGGASKLASAAPSSVSSSVQPIPPSPQIIQIAPQTINVNLDGQQIAQVIAPAMRVQALQTIGRQTGNIYGGNAGRQTPSS